MSVSQYQNQVNSLDKEIADLEKKKAAIGKECAKLQSNNIIDSVLKEHKL